MHQHETASNHEKAAYRKPSKSAVSEPVNEEKARTSIEHSSKAAGYLHKLTDLNFKLSEKDIGVEYVGDVTVSQYDRFRFIADYANLTFHERFTDKCSNCRHIVIQSGDIQKLAALSDKEDKRREEGAEAADILERITGKEWCWDGLCLSTPFPGADPEDPINKAIVKMKHTGVINGKNGVVRYDAPQPNGSTQSWITLHDFNIERLRDLDKSRSASVGK